MEKDISLDDNILGREEISVLLKKFATPSVVAMIVGAFYNIVDQIFIGNSVGVAGNAATNVAFPLTTICLSISLLIGIGGAASFNLRLGEGDVDKAKKYLGNAFAMIIIAGVLLTLIARLFLKPLLIAFGASGENLGYAITYTSITSVGFLFFILTNAGTGLIRADGSPRYSMVATLIGGITNLILDPIFIFVFGWGMAGAAWATVIGQVLSGLMVLNYARNFKSVKLEKSDFIPKSYYIKNIASLGVAPLINQLSLLVVQVLINRSVGYYGANSRFGSVIPLAVVGIGMKVFMIFFSSALGIAQGMQPIVSYNYGARKYERAKEAYKLSVKAAMIILSVAFLLFQFIPDQIIGLFGKGSDAYYEFGRYFFRIYLMMTFLVPIQPLTTNLLTSIGHAKKGIFVSLTRQIIFFVPLALILPRFFGIMGLIYTGPIADFISFIVASFMAKKVFDEMDELEKNQ
ncbi:MAG: MATE family efflux transporter [Peptoniphilaceae bacterium]|nr:MATE family efflux transporter [Peptoniphilaceae bacterium]MDY6018345.1 MATE family efflux transporter [Anaerococcus sp.]